MNEKTWGDIIAGAEAGFELIAPGTYEWQIVSANAKPSGTGKPSIQTKSVILSGPLAGKPAWKLLVFEEDNPGLMGIRLQELSALGIDPAMYSGTLEQVLEQIAPALVNRTYKAQLTHRQWQGTTRNEIGIFQKREAGGLPAAPGGPAVTAPTVTTPVVAETPASAIPPPPGMDEAPF